MGEYDPQAIVDSYTAYDEVSRVDRSSDAAIMFQIERWFIERYLPDSGTVIDVGGGPGRFSVEIAKLGRDVVLVDLTPKHIEQAKQLAEQEGVSDKIVDYRVMDIRDLSAFGSGESSMAVCYGMLNYTLDRDVYVLSELGRIVQRGNPILVSAMGLYGAVRYVWAQGRLADPSYRERERDVLETGVNAFRRPCRKFYTVASLCATAEKAGLRVLEVAGTPAIAACLGQEIDNARQDPEAWAYLIETEKKACTVPGLVDAGQHIILAAVREGTAK
jgi:ubiquinone/menaquinone biosynthesis C-methylase UbiE